MNETRKLFQIRDPRRRLSLVLSASMLGLLTTALLMVIQSCADPRNPPTQTPDPAYSETINLWDNAVSNGAQVPATFTVDAELAPIIQPGVDHPAKLTVACYIAPDADILHYEHVVDTLLPAANRVVTEYQTVLDALVSSTDSLNRIDTSFAAHCNPCVSCPCTTNCDYDTCGMAARFEEIASIRVDYQGRLATATFTRDSLILVASDIGAVVDDRYRLALWLDDPAGPPIYPSAVFTAENFLAGQGIYLARTDTTTGMKGRGFTFNLDGFPVADPTIENLGYTYNVDWARCPVGSTRPCLSPGTTHTIYAQISGANTRLTGALLLVYEGERP